MPARKKRSTKETVEAIKEAALEEADETGEALTLKQEAFVRAYLETGNASEAYRRAYNAENMSEGAINVEACRLLQHPKVAHRTAAYRKKAEEQTLLTLEDHMAELQALREMSKQNGQMSAAITAEVKRGELRKFYVKQVETGDAGDFKRLSDEELQVQAIEAAAKVRRMNTNGRGTEH